MPHGAPNRLVQKQIDNNAASQPRWELFGPHRERVTQLILDAVRGMQPRERRTRVALLGAGNCNDLELSRLAEVADLHLVDLDEHAMRDALRRQQPQRVASVCVHRRDVTGVIDALADPTSWTPETFGELLARVESGSDWPTRTGASDAATFADCDLVVSLNLLTQLVDIALHARGAQDALFVQAALALQESHLMLLRRLRAPAGRCLLVTDAVSSLTCPDLPQIPREQLANYLLQQVRVGNFFTGANPWSIAQKLQARGEHVRMHAPWRWNLGPRTYLVVALEFETAQQCDESSSIQR